MVDSHAHDTTYEPEVLQMMLIAETRVRVDLEGVVITGEREREREREAEGGGGEHIKFYIGLVTAIMSTHPAEYSNRP